MKYQQDYKQKLKALDIQWLEPQGGKEGGAIWLTRRAPGESFIAVNQDLFGVQFQLSRIDELHEDCEIDVQHRRNKQCQVMLEEVYAK